MSKDGTQSPQDDEGAVIDSLPRVGSTSLARALNQHPDISVLIEPFHPRRYDGRFHQNALAQGSVAPVLRSIWRRFHVIKHVWEENAWPFHDSPQLNDEVVLKTAKVVSMKRRNLLRRYVSNVLSRRLNFWIGTRQEFRSRIQEQDFIELHPPRVLTSLRRDAAAVSQREALLAARGHQVMYLMYEDLFGQSVTDDAKFEYFNNVIAFLGFRPLLEQEYLSGPAQFFRSDIYRWADEDLYQHLPNGRELDSALATEGFGRLFEP